MGIKIGTTNPGTGNKHVGGTSNTITMGEGGGVCGTPMWNDIVLWNDLKIWID